MQNQNLISTISGVFGSVLYLIVGYIYLVSGLAVPIPWLLILWVVWLGGLAMVVRVWRRRRMWTPLVAVAAFAFWAIYLSVGSALFDWTA